MKTIFIDYETYYDKEYSLRKMTPVEYVLDHRFECIGCAVNCSAENPKIGKDGDPELMRRTISFRRSVIALRPETEFVTNLTFVAAPSVEMQPNPSARCHPSPVLVL